MIARTTRVALALGAALALAAPAGVATAREDDEVERHGSCSGTAGWELDAEREGTRLEVGFEVDRAPAADVWRVRLWQEGRLIADVHRTAGADHGFDVERLTANTPGRDTFAARAVDRATGQVCKGSLTYPA
jgi:hypothetical protein